MTEEQAKALQAENARLKALLENSFTKLEYDELQAENAMLKEKNAKMNNLLNRGIDILRAWEALKDKDNE